MKKIVIIGGGFTGAKCALRLQHDFDVTLIDTKPYFEFTPAILRTILEPDHQNTIQRTHTNYLPKANVIIDTVATINKTNVKTKQGKTYPFDYLIIASGSRYASPIKEPDLLPATRASELASYHKQLEDAQKIAIIGGGLVGIELAAEICTHYKGKTITVVHSRDELLNRNLAKTRRHAQRFLERRNVTIAFNERFKQKKGKTIITENGTKIDADMIFMCIGIEPNYDFMKTSFKQTLTDRNSIKVNQYLQCEGTTNIFCGGDIAAIQEEKTAQTAERHADTIVENIRNLEHKKPLREYTTKKRPMLISLGKHDGILDTGKIAITGFIPAIMKHYVEWKTMKHFK